MRSFFKPAFAIGILALSVLLSISAFQLPSAQPLTAGEEEFSSARAMKHVGKIAVNIHPAGSPELEPIREYIINELAALGLKPEIQKGYGENDAEGFMGFVPYSGELKNIYARLEGTGNTDQDILMLAHYDSTLGGPGAADDASSVAVLLETARALISDKPLMNDIVFLFTDGEEADLLGAKLFTENADILRDVGLVLNFEARGNRGLSLMFETSDGNERLMKEFKTAVPYPRAYSFTMDVLKMVTNVTDFTPFINAGKSGLNFSNLGGHETYHNPQDTPENLDPGFVQHQGSYALSLARHFGNIPLDKVNSSNNAVYFTLAGSWMVLYSDQWNVPLTILALIFLLAAMYVGFRKRFLSLRGMTSGFLVSLLIIVAASGFGIAAQVLFQTIYFKLDNVLSLADLVTLRRTLILEGNKWIVGSLILTGIVLIGLQRLFRRKTAGCNLLFGSIFTWSILAVISAFYLPGAGYIFLWPLIISSAGLLIEFSTNSEIVPKFMVLFGLCTLACILIYVPVGYVLFEALTMMGAGIPIAILSLPASLVLLTTSYFSDPPVPLEAPLSQKPQIVHNSTLSYQ